MTGNFKRGYPAKTPGWALLSSAGFTMIEMLMVLAIISIAFGTIYKSFEQLNRSTATENVKAGAQQAVRIAVDFMVQDIRLAGLNPLGSPGIGIQAATPESIQFTMDANFDGDDEDTFENITYGFNSGNGTLVQTNHLGDEVLIDNITSLNFTYLDSDDQTTSDLDEIRSVIVSLTMQRPAGRDPDISRTYTTRVRCRNL
ncbi:MAG: prepilin-type N-terminal cleavage/methylation domain-containing protein [Desulfobacteraceae bacterium]|jgi:type IV pilus assembly protein PilW|nr:prepilin-type N-terminal cleavage/methylation domain-containing protein [Desulfobacteraceae bacterium]